MRLTNFNIEEDKHKLLKLKAVQEDTDVSKLLRKAVDDILKE